MILIFGGTTEGRMAIEVCEQAGRSFYYSTKGSYQNVELHHGVRLTGAMSAEDIGCFCKMNGIACIVDAAHPFAANLHKAIGECRIPVIRLQRDFGRRIDGVVYCKNFDDATEKMRAAGTQRLLALSGANTIGRLRDFWECIPTVFRILERSESIEVAKCAGFPLGDLIFYKDVLPSVEDEKRVMREVGCDSVITKESGESGGFSAKVTAALELGLKVFVVEHPTLPLSWHYVSGKHGLRRAIERTVPDFFPLKTGFTTGACATAAAKAAMLSLLGEECPPELSFMLPDGETVSIPVTVGSSGQASVVKDFSDDPDVTKGCKITVRIHANDSGDIHFTQGEGVGIVTLPGLGIPVGEPAVNPTPRRMICDEIRRLSDGGYDVEISVEDGAEIAKRTFNQKVGVVGGISIIGTSGIVSPLSNEAFIHSIGRELEVAKAIGCTQIGIASGKKGEDELRRIYPTLRTIHYGNLIGETLKIAHRLGFAKVVLGIMIGKAVKLAEGHLDTHSHKVGMNKEFLMDVLCEEIGCGHIPESSASELRKRLSDVSMARELWTFMPQAFMDRIVELCHKHCSDVFPAGELEIRLTCDTQN